MTRRPVADPPCVLTINGGSSSIRFAVYEAADARRRLAGKLDRIGLGDTNLVVSDVAGEPNACGSPKHCPYVVDAIREVNRSIGKAILAGTRSDFERGTFEHPQLTPGAPSIAAGVTSSAYAA